MLGIWVIVIPHLGVPNTWQFAIITVTGIVVVCLGLYMRAKALSRNRSGHNHPFVENADVHAGHEHLAQ